MRAYGDGDEMDRHGKGSLEGGYIELYAAGSLPSPLSMVTTLLLGMSHAEAIEQATTYCGRNTDCGSHGAGYG